MSLILPTRDGNLGIQKYLARQPIFDRNHTVLGYELLFRSGLENFFQPQAGGNATEYVVDNYLLVGIESLTGGGRAFINFTREALIRDYPTLLPSDRLVVEILEDIPADKEVMAACRRLKDAGYMIALDDVNMARSLSPLVTLADIVKVDFLITTPDERESLARKFLPMGVRLVAEKVETQEEAARAQQMGYSCFQGYFFCRPQLLLSRDIPSYRLNYLRMLQAINRREVNLREVEDILRQEPSLLFKLLRYLNSAYFGFRSRVASIRHALTLLGEQNLRKWTSVVALVDLAQEKPAELIVTSLVRARFCELLASRVGLANQQTDLFLLGLLSVMDAVLDRELGDVLSDMPLSEQVKAALLGEENSLRHALDSVVAHERADWNQLRNSFDRLALREGQFPELYPEAVQWATRIFRF